MFTMQMAVDGRSARRERNRQAVVEAALGLMDAGELDPAVEEITEMSGVSQRSIFRYFDGLDDLRRAVIQQHFARIKPLIAGSDGDGPVDERIKRFVNSRLKLYDMAPNAARAARTRAPYSELLAEDVRQFREDLNLQVKSMFAPELKKRRNADAGELTMLIGSIVSFDSWEQLVSVHNRSTSQIRKVWIRGVTTLLDA